MKPFRVFFSQAILKYYPCQAQKIICKTEAHYAIIAEDVLFVQSSKNPIDKRLIFCAYFLALIQTLDEMGETFESIRQICLEITTNYVQPKNIFEKWLKRAIPKLVNTILGQALVKQFHKKISQNTNPDGFIAHIITDKEQTFGLGYGVDIIECGICKLFNRHHYSKFATILCEVDEITSQLAGLKLIRSGTIANGAKKCDFRFILQTEL